MGGVDHARRPGGRHQPGPARTAGRLPRVPRAGRPGEDGGHRGRGLRRALGARRGRGVDKEFDAFGLPFDHRASRFAEAFEIARRLLAGERVTYDGRFHQVEDAVLLPMPARRPPLVVGSVGERVLATALPHVDGWNTWFEWFGNTPEGFAARKHEIDDACARAGRRPEDVERSACVLVALEPGEQERSFEGVAPLTGSPERVAAAFRAHAEAGASEVIVVASPITEASIRTLGGTLGLLGACGS